MLHSYTNASRTHSLTGRTELGIYKRQQESKKTRTRPRKRSRKQENKNLTKKKRKNFLFLERFPICFYGRTVFEAPHLRKRNIVPPTNNSCNRPCLYRLLPDFLRPLFCPSVKLILSLSLVMPRIKKIVIFLYFSKNAKIYFSPLQ